MLKNILIVIITDGKSNISPSKRIKNIAFHFHDINNLNRELWLYLWKKVLVFIQGKL